MNEAYNSYGFTSANDDLQGRAPVQADALFGSVPTDLPAMGRAQQPAGPHPGAGWAAGGGDDFLQAAPWQSQRPARDEGPATAAGPLESFYTAPQRLDDAGDEDDGEQAPAREGEGFSYMQNRELSWLTFNERVLDQGADESVPLLDRLNFISIFWSNLQEFFMVRVGSLTDLTFIDPPVVDEKTGMTVQQQIKAIHERCRELYPIQESYYEHVRGSLAKQGVRHLRPDDLSDEQRNYLSGYVKYNVEPFLSPQIINPRHPFPHLENGKLYILVRLDDEADAAERKKKDKKGKKGKKDKQKEKGGAAGVVLGLIPLPHQCERVIKLPGRGFQFILLEHAIEMFAPDVFSMYKIKHTNVVCVTRNADLDASQGGDEQDEDYREHMKRLLKKRARLAPVRLECERPLSPVLEKALLKKLGLKRSQVYDTIVPLDLSFTWDLGSRLSEAKRAALTCEPFAPAWPAAFDRNRRIIDQVGERDILLSYPYESMDPFVQLLREAAFDPSVVSIKITLYRLASQSQLAEALIAAAENGKEVTALFELRARFDENNNIEWSQRFEQAGCNVIYGFRDYKVHSKICCITRQDERGVQRITQLGTGNYNEKTAKLYTDFSFITTDEQFGRDATEFFRNMQLENVSDEYEVLSVAPLQIKQVILQNLDRQIALARAGRPCGAFLKANSITDVDVIQKIVEASQEGVGITLFIRGICCVVPGVKGHTDNVRVVSIVGRLLEHSRIYCFGTPDDCVMYLSSADLMTRNLNKRVEIAWPVLSPDIRWDILEYIDICLHDTAKLRELRPNATYTPLGAFCDLDEDGNAQPAFDSQAALIARAAEAAGQEGEAPSPEPAAEEAVGETAPADDAEFPAPAVHDIGYPLPDDAVDGAPGPLDAGAAAGAAVVAPVFDSPVRTLADTMADPDEPIGVVMPDYDYAAAPLPALEEAPAVQVIEPGAALLEPEPVAFAPESEPASFAPEPAPAPALEGAPAVQAIEPDPGFPAQDGQTPVLPVAPDEGPQPGAPGSPAGSVDGLAGAVPLSDFAFAGESRVQEPAAETAQDEPKLTDMTLDEIFADFSIEPAPAPQPQEAAVPEPQPPAGAEPPCEPQELIPQNAPLQADPLQVVPVSGPVADGLPAGGDRSGAAESLAAALATAEAPAVTETADIAPAPEAQEAADPAPVVPEAPQEAPVPLTELSVQDLIGGASPEYPGGAAPDQAPLRSDEIFGAAPVEFAPAEAQPQVSPVQPLAQQAPVEAPAAATAAVAQAEPGAEEPKSFFDEENRQIQMPPENMGFFARLRAK